MKKAVMALAAVTVMSGALSLSLARGDVLVGVLANHSGDAWRSGAECGGVPGKVFFFFQVCTRVFHSVDLSSASSNLGYVGLSCSLSFRSFSICRVSKTEGKKPKLKR